MLPSLLLAVMLGACSALPVEKAKDPPSDAGAVPVEGASAGSETLPPKTRSRRERRTERPGPIPVRAINVAAQCDFRDETGYAGSLTLTVEEATVKAFIASISIPKHGVCRFDLKSFRQTKSLPAVELSHLKDACKVRVWEQGERITVAFDACRKMCSGNAWPYLWPILADTRDGSCA